MVFYRKYRRTGRGYARRGRSGYSMYKLYKSRNSGAQARQIYGLNKKLKAIQRLTKPEINIAPLVQGSLLSSEGGNFYNGVRIFGPTKLTNLVSADMSGASSNTNALLDGRFARIQNVTMKGIFTYDRASTGELDPVDLQRMLCYMRIVIFQTKASRGQDINYSDVFSTTIAGTKSQGTSNDLNAYSMIRAPLKYGLARVAKVMSDKTYMISDTKQAVNIKTKLRYVRNWYKAPSEAGPKGDVWMIVMMFNQTADSTDDVSRCRFNYISKCVYTDA